MNVLTTRELKERLNELQGQTVMLQGWIRNHRKQKNMGFIDFFDGTCFKNPQVVYDNTIEDYAAIQALHVGAAITVTGKVVPSYKDPTTPEVQAIAIHLEGDCPEDYPLQPKRHSVEYLREIAYLRPRTRLFQAVFRVRSVASMAIHTYFQDRGYLYVHTPLITANDAEGAGNTFTVTTLPPSEQKDGSNDFFGKPTSLAVTGQLEAETFAMAFSKVYTFGPTFRAENSNTKTHAAEFWMIEPEIAFADLEDNMKLADDMLRYVVKHLLTKCSQELEFFNKFFDKGLIERLEKLLATPSAHLTYTEAIKVLEAQKDRFEYPVYWGCDLQTEHERFLSEEYAHGPIFITDYPKEIKSFYMRQNDDGKTVAAMDMLVPGIGEIIGGSQREERLDLLEKRMEELGLDEKDYWWYLDLRRYGGTRHAGYGLGFERLIMYVTGIPNIRDVIPYPRTVGSAEF